MTPMRAPCGTPIIGIVGWKNSGKTTLVVKLVEEFTRRGLSVATVKHAHHSFQIDDAGTDSARHRRAGAAQVAIVSARRWALVTETPDEPDFSAVIAMLKPCDLVIVEGYKTAPIAKIECRLTAAAPGKPLASGDPNVIAIATGDPAAHRGPLPVFALDAIAAIAGFITSHLGVKKSTA